jgi:hypothetical protein
MKLKKMHDCTWKVDMGNYLLARMSLGMDIETWFSERKLDWIWKERNQWKVGDKWVGLQLPTQGSFPTQHQLETVAKTFHCHMVTAPLSVPRAIWSET